MQVGVGWATIPFCFAKTCKRSKCGASLWSLKSAESLSKCCPLTTRRRWGARSAKNHSVEILSPEIMTHFTSFVFQTVFLVNDIFSYWNLTINYLESDRRRLIFLFKNTFLLCIKNCYYYLLCFHFFEPLEKLLRITPYNTIWSKTRLVL